MMPFLEAWGTKKEQVVLYLKMVEEPCNRLAGTELHLILSTWHKGLVSEKKKKVVAELCKVSSGRGRGDALMLPDGCVRGASVPDGASLGSLGRFVARSILWHDHGGGIG
jgi:hypothetical protein